MADVSAAERAREKYTQTATPLGGDPTDKKKRGAAMQHAGEFTQGVTEGGLFPLYGGAGLGVGTIESYYKLKDAIAPSEGTRSQINRNLDNETGFFQSLRKPFMGEEDWKEYYFWDAEKRYRMMREGQAKQGKGMPPILEGIDNVPPGQPISHTFEALSKPADHVPVSGYDAIKGRVDKAFEPVNLHNVTAEEINQRTDGANKFGGGLNILGSFIGGYAPLKYGKEVAEMSAEAILRAVGKEIPKSVVDQRKRIEDAIKIVSGGADEAANVVGKEASGILKEALETLADMPPKMARQIRNNPGEYNEQVVHAAKKVLGETMPQRLGALGAGAAITAGTGYGAATGSGATPAELYDSSKLNAGLWQFGTAMAPIAAKTVAHASGRVGLEAMENLSKKSDEFARATGKVVSESEQHSLNQILATLKKAELDGEIPEGVVAMFHNTARAPDQATFNANMLALQKRVKGIRTYRREVFDRLEEAFSIINKRVRDTYDPIVAEEAGLTASALKKIKEDAVASNPDAKNPFLPTDDYVQNHDLYRSEVRNQWHNFAKGMGEEYDALGKRGAGIHINLVSEKATEAEKRDFLAMMAYKDADGNWISNLTGDVIDEQKLKAAIGNKEVEKIIKSISNQTDGMRIGVDNDDRAATVLHQLHRVLARTFDKQGEEFGSITFQDYMDARRALNKLEIMAPEFNKNLQNAIKKMQWGFRQILNESMEKEQVAALAAQKAGKEYSTPLADASNELKSLNERWAAGKRTYRPDELKHFYRLDRRSMPKEALATARVAIDKSGELEVEGYDTLLNAVGKNAKGEPNYHLANQIMIDQIKKIVVKDEVADPEMLVKFLTRNSSFFGYGNASTRAGRVALNEQIWQEFGNSIFKGYLGTDLKEVADLMNNLDATTFTHMVQRANKIENGGAKIISNRILSSLSELGGKRRMELFNELIPKLREAGVPSKRLQVLGAVNELAFYAEARHPFGVRPNLDTMSGRVMASIEKLQDKAGMQFRTMTSAMRSFAFRYTSGFTSIHGVLAPHIIDSMVNKQFIDELFKTSFNDARFTQLLGDVLERYNKGRINENQAYMAFAGLMNATGKFGFASGTYDRDTDEKARQQQAVWYKKMTGKEMPQ